MPTSNLTTIWEFHVKPGARSQFAKIYGPEGDWAQLFRRSSEYRGTTLLHDHDHPDRSLTLDHWTSREALQQFKRDHHSEYVALDKQCASLTVQEIFIGDFENVASESTWPKVGAKNLEPRV